jgi:hypothetical protein
MPSLPMKKNSYCVLRPEAERPGLPHDGLSGVVQRGLILRAVLRYFRLPTQRFENSN